MRISTIAFANLRRRKGKAAFLAAGIALGIGTVVALLSLGTTIRKEIGDQLDRFGANIVVAPRSNSVALSYGGVPVQSVSYDAAELTDADVVAISKIPYANRLSSVAPKILGTMKADDRDVVLAGVDFDAELRLKRWWQIGGRRPAAPGELLVGSGAALTLGLTGDPAAAATTAPAAGPAAHGGDHGHGSHAAPPPPPKALIPGRETIVIGGRPYRVAGTLAPTGGPEDQMVFASLAEAQQLLGKPGKVSLVEVSALCKDCPVEDLVGQISAQVPAAKVSAIQQAVKAREETVSRLGRFSAVVSTVILAIAALLIFTSMTGAVIERTREIGVHRAIGFRRSHVARSLSIEVAVVSLLGGVTGWLGGTLVGWAALPYFAETELAFEPRPILVPVAVLGALTIGLISSALPILRATRLDPADAVRAA